MPERANVAEDLYVVAVPSLVKLCARSELRGRNTVERTSPRRSFSPAGRSGATPVISVWRRTECGRASRTRAAISGATSGSPSLNRRSTQTPNQAECPSGAMIAELLPRRKPRSETGLIDSPPRDRLAHDGCARYRVATLTVATSQAETTLS